MNIAIWGLGISGLSALKYLCQRTSQNNLNNTDQIWAINQGEPESWNGLETVLAHIPRERCLSQAKASRLMGRVDQIILAPGISRKQPEVQAFIDAGVEVICEIELAYRDSDIPVVALTGTNGKTTTATMIAEALSLAGKKVFLGGNIGVPFCEALLGEGISQYDIAVLELSSFQLESLDSFRANLAFILNITPSHMERYNSFEDYRDAKYNIVMNQEEADCFMAPVSILNEVNTLALKEELKVLENVDYQNSKLVGAHNKTNFFCAYTALKFFKIDKPEEKIQSLVDSFGGVKFRLQYLRTFKNCHFYNDGKSTNTASTLAAITAFEPDAVTLILGGKLRGEGQKLGVKFKGLNINEVLAFGDAKDFVKEELENEFSVKTFDNLDELFDKTDFSILDGNIVFSPAFPSFDQYQNYIERCEHFERCVALL